MGLKIQQDTRQAMYDVHNAHNAGILPIQFCHNFSVLYLRCMYSKLFFLQADKGKNRSHPNCNTNIKNPNVLGV